MPSALPSPAQRVILLAALCTAVLVLCTGCISYTVGMGAETTPVGERASSSSLNWVPGTLGDSGYRRATHRPSLDSDFRYGIDDRTDVGVRLATYSGVMVTWKRQLTRADTASAPENRTRTAVMLGGGVLNAGEHAGLEATLVTSGPWSAVGQPYAAARAIAAAFP